MIRTQNTEGKNPEKFNFLVIIVAAILILLAGMLSVGLAGLKSMALYLIFFVFPAYLILSSHNFGLLPEEILVFSLFAGLVITSLATYYIQIILPSLKWSAIILWFILVTIGIFLKFYHKKKKS